MDKIIAIIPYFFKGFLRTNRRLTFVISFDIFLCLKNEAPFVNGGGKGVCPAKKS